MLIVGSGGREDALVWALSRSPRIRLLRCAPGNAGTARRAEPVPIGAEEVQALVEASGRFELVALLGALDIDLPLDDEKHSWRMIPVLRKRETTS